MGMQQGHDTERQNCKLPVCVCVCARARACVCVCVWDTHIFNHSIVNSEILNAIHHILPYKKTEKAIQKTNNPGFWASRKEDNSIPGL